MSLNLEASQDFYTSLNSIDVLLDFAKSEDEKGNQDNRVLFLKLSVVSMVTKFQVFIENILKEFSYLLSKSGVKFNNLPVHIRLNSIKLHSEEFVLPKKLSNRESYNESKLDKIKEHLKNLNAHFKGTRLDNSFKIKESFPLGKTGKKELIDLFFQVEGKNIFESDNFDIDIIDGILLTRHLIIHQDLDPGLTEERILEYQTYFKKICDVVDNYLNACLLSFLK